jgi:hypothetical protein
MPRKTFAKNRLIYTKTFNSDGSMRWFSGEACRQKKLDLEREYPLSVRLVRCIFASGDAKVDTMVAKAKLINRSTKLQDISELFAHFSEALHGLSFEKARLAVKELRGKSIFPVRESENQSGFDSLATSDEQSKWFIADRDHLRKSFAGRVALLAFKIEDMERIEYLLQLLELDSRKLSDRVKIDAIPPRGFKLMAEYSKSLRSKAQFLFR